MKYALFGHGGYYNRGSEAIIRTTANMIKQNDDDAKLTLVSYDYKNDQASDYGVMDHIMCYGNVRYTLPHLMAYGFRKIGMSKLDIKLQYQWLYPLLKTHDVFFSTGGDNYCYEEPIDYFHVDKLVKEAGKKLVLWGASIDGEKITDGMIEDFKRFDAIVVRETLSYETLKGLGIPNVHLHPDPAFTLNVEQKPLPKGWKEGDTIGINLSPLSKRYAKSPEIYDQAVTNMIDHILENTESHIAFIPHVVNPNMPDTQDDTRALRPLYERYKDTGRVCLIDHASNNAEQVKGYIARCRLFIGARTHSTIAAYSTGVPTLVLGYSIKSRGIAKDIFGDHKDHVLPVQEVTTESKLVETFDAFLAREDAVRAHLADFIPGYKERSAEAASRIKDVLR